MEYDDAPQWLKAADSHAVADSGTSIFDFSPTRDGEAQGETQSDDFIDRRIKNISNIPIATEAAAYSAITSFINSGIAATNFVTASDIEYVDPEKVMTEMDSDLGLYYKENKDFVDMAGFIGGSIVPILGATKLLSATQLALKAAGNGMIGTNMSRATGLLVPALEVNVQKHAATLASRNAIWKLNQQGTVETILAGVHQGVLEGVVSETAILATQFKSPVLDDMSALELLQNFAVGSVGVGAPVGALYGGIKSYFGTAKLLKNAGVRETALAAQSTALRSSSAYNATNEADAIVAAAADRANLAGTVSSNDVLAYKLAQNEQGFSISPEAVDQEVTFLNSQREQNLRDLNNTIRTNIRGLYKSTSTVRKDTGKGGEKSFLGNIVADTFVSLPDASQYKLFDRMAQYVRLGGESLHDKLVKRIAQEKKLPKKVAELLAGEDTTAYIQLHSGKFVSVHEAAPIDIRLADTFNPSQIGDAVKDATAGLSKTFNIMEKIRSNSTKLKFHELEARWIAARTAGPKKLKDIGTETNPIDEYDLPMLWRFINSDTGSAPSEVHVIRKYADDESEVVKVTGGAPLKYFYNERQSDVIEFMLRDGMDIDKIELATNVRADAIQGVVKNRYAFDAPELAAAQESYAKELSDYLGVEISPVDLHYRPKYIKASYMDDGVDSAGGNLAGAAGLVGVKYRQHIYQEAADRAVANVLGYGVDSFIPYTANILSKLWRGGTGQGILSPAGGSYGSMESVTSHNGNIVSKLEKDTITKLKARVDESSKLLVESEETAIRFSTLNEIIAGEKEFFTVNASGDALVPLKLKQWEEDMIAAAVTGKAPVYPTLAPGTTESIPLNTPEIRRVVAEHINATDHTNSNRKILAAVSGNTNDNVAGVFHPMRQDPRQFKHVAIVSDPLIAGVGHKRMLIARSGEDLEDQIAKVPKQYKVIRSTESSDYYEAMDGWLYEKTLHDNFLDSELKRAGVRSAFFPMTDKQLIADTYLQHHIRRETSVFREAIKVKFQPVIKELEKRGQLYSGAHSSATDYTDNLSVSSKKNPYMAQIKSLLNLSRVEDLPGWWMSSQQALDHNISKVWNAATDLFIRHPKLTSGESIKTVRKVFDEFGFRDPNAPSLPKVIEGTPVTSSFGPVDTVQQSAFGRMYTAPEAVQHVINNGGALLARLGQKLLPYLDTVDFTVLPKADYIQTAGKHAQSAGLYRLDGVKGINSILIKEGNDVNITVMHEATHAATVAKIQIGLEHGDQELASAVRELHSLFNKSKKLFEAGSGPSSQYSMELQHYGRLAFNDILEFVTYGMTEPVFQTFLKNTSGFKAGPNAFNTFVADVKNILGADFIPDSALANLIDVTGKLVDGDINLAIKQKYPLLFGPEPTPKHIKEIDKLIDDSTKIYEEAGFRSAYWGAAEQILANTKIPNGVFTTFVRAANSFLINSVLRWDPINAFLNKLGNTMMLSTELNALIGDIRKGNVDGAGELAKLGNIKLVGNDAQIFSVNKVIASAYKDLHGENSIDIWQQLYDQGLIYDTMEQYHKGIDALTITGSETVEDMTRKTAQVKHSLQNWGEAAAKATGNVWVEKVNRAVAALSVKKITDIAVREGIIEPKEAWAYINLMVNKVSGSIRAAERPLMFQGPIGQAMGLFQSYQLNLMQQTFRHIGEGRGKTLALMAGLQTTIFGASSLPGFDLINSHLIGNASGNPEHNDIYTASQTLLGKTGAEWLMYGAPSNILNASIFTRGDVNPRHWTIVPNPTNPSEIPIVSSYANAISSIYNATSSVAGGAPVWDSFLSGLEHLGLSRPLSGLAVSARALTDDNLQASSTQKSGAFLHNNDLLSLTTLMRIAGAKPMDEAIMQNNLFRINSYAASDRKKRNDLGRAIRISMSNGDVPSNADVGDFARDYAASGGNASRFNAYFMQQYKNATVSQAKQLSERLSSPYGRNMQLLLGGSTSYVDDDGSASQ